VLQKAHIEAVFVVVSCNTHQQHPNMYSLCFRLFSQVLLYKVLVRFWVIWKQKMKNV